jgi:hypothetical protein
MTVQYTPHWNDGLTHADADRIRQAGLDWAMHLLAGQLDRYHSAADALDQHEARFGWDSATYGELRHKRNLAAYAVVGAAEAVVKYAR